MSSKAPRFSHCGLVRPGEHQNWNDKSSRSRGPAPRVLLCPALGACFRLLQSPVAVLTRIQHDFVIQDNVKNSCKSRNRNGFRNIPGSSSQRVVVVDIHHLQCQWPFAVRTDSLISWSHPFDYPTVSEGIRRQTISGTSNNFSGIQAGFIRSYHRRPQEHKASDKYTLDDSSRSARVGRSCRPHSVRLQKSGWLIRCSIPCCSPYGQSRSTLHHPVRLPQVMISNAHCPFPIHENESSSA
jgi:hypothetical protein